jgi:hypothetical protein
MFAPGVSGNPSGQRRLKDRAEELFQIMVVDIRPLTKTDEMLLKHAALLIARAEKVHHRKNVDASCRMSGEARRLIASLRRRPESSEPRTPSLSEYLESIEDESADEAEQREQREQG